MAGPAVKARGNLLPLVRMSDDHVRFGMPQSLIDMWRNITLPRDVLAGAREPTPEAGLGFALDWGLGGMGSSALPGMVPEGELAGMFVGPRATNFNPQAAEDAAAMAARGVGPHAQAQQTGYFVGHEGEPRTEISDHRATLNPDIDWMEVAKMKGQPGGTVPLSTVLEHPRLYEEYPQLADRPVSPTFGSSEYGAYYPDTGAISFNPTRDPAEMRKTLLHETQHAVQGIEGFDPGSSPSRSQAEASAALDASRPPELDAYLKAESVAADAMEGREWLQGMSSHLAAFDRAQGPLNRQEYLSTLGGVVKTIYPGVRSMSDDRMAEVLANRAGVTVDDPNYQARVLAKLREDYGHATRGRIAARLQDTGYASSMNYAERLAEQAMADPALRQEMIEHFDRSISAPGPSPEVLEYLRRDALLRKSDDFALYQMRGGEEEARRTANRADLTPRERYLTNPDEITRNKGDSPVKRVDRFILSTKRAPFVEPKPKLPMKHLKAGWNRT